MPLLLISQVYLFLIRVEALRWGFWLERVSCRAIVAATTTAAKDHPVASFLLTEVSLQGSLVADSC